MIHEQELKNFLENLSELEQNYLTEALHLSNFHNDFLHQAIKTKSKKLFIFNLKILPNKQIATFLQDIEELKNLKYLEHIKLNIHQQKDLILEFYDLIKICLNAQLR